MTTPPRSGRRHRARRADADTVGVDEHPARGPAGLQLTLFAMTRTRRLPLACNSWRSRSTTWWPAWPVRATSPTRGWPPPCSWPLRLRRPLLLEGDAGVGKTEVAQALSAWTGGAPDPAPVLRGHRRRPGPLRVGLRPPAAPPPGRRGHRGGRRAHRRPGGDALRRALPRAPRAPGRPRRPPRRAGAGAAHRRDRPGRRRVRGVPPGGAGRLRGDHPELGTITATVPPVVVLTSNRTRDVHDALKRRCLYHWVEHPGLRPGGGDRPPAGTRGAGGHRPPGRRRRRRAARARPLQAARRGRDDRLGRRRSHASACPAARRAGRRRATLGAVARSTARTTSGSAQHGFADLVTRALERAV